MAVRPEAEKVTNRLIRKARKDKDKQAVAYWTNHLKWIKKQPIKEDDDASKTRSTKNKGRPRKKPARNNKG